MIQNRIQSCLYRYNHQKMITEELEEKLSEAKKRLRELIYNELPDVLLEYGLSECVVDGNKFEIKTYVNAQINKDNYTEALEWIEDSGYGYVKINCNIPLASDDEADQLMMRIGDEFTAIFKKDIHHQTLKAAVRRMLEDGIKIPENLIKVESGTYCNISEGK